MELLSQFPSSAYECHFNLYEVESGPISVYIPCQSRIGFAQVFGQAVFQFALRRAISTKTGEDVGKDFENLVYLVIGNLKLH
jgi:hypothetical protein